MLIALFYLLLFQVLTFKVTVIGDWGSPIDGTNTPNQKQLRVAELYNSLPQDYNFTISVGDNFYPAGVTSALDPYFKTLWKDVYNNNTYWYLVAGNHDWYGNIQGQITYSTLDPQWEFPGLYYWKYQPDINAYFIYCDTEILINNKGYSNEEMKREHYEWLNETLEMAQSATWVVVIGHYHIYSGDSYEQFPLMKSEFLPILKKYRVNLYLCGHNHLSEFIYYDKIGFVINGDGGRYQDNTYNTNYFPKAVFYNSDDIGSVTQLDFIDNNRIEISFLMADEKRQVITTALRNVRLDKSEF